MTPVNQQAQCAARPGVPAIIGTLVALGMLVLFGFQHLALFAPLPMRLAPWLLSVLCLLAAARGASFDEAHSRAVNLSYVQPQDDAPALQALTDVQLVSWARPLFATEKARRKGSAVFGQSASLRWLAAVPALGIAVPRIEVDADHVEGNKRLLTLIVRSSRLARRLDVTVEGVKVLHAFINGQPYARADDGQWKVDAFGMQDQSLCIELELESGLQCAFGLRISREDWQRPACRRVRWT